MFLNYYYQGSFSTERAVTEQISFNYTQNVSTDLISLNTDFSLKLNHLGMSTSKDIAGSCGTYTPWNITQPLKRIHLNQF